MESLSHSKLLVLPSLPSTARLLPCSSILITDDVTATTTMMETTKTWNQLINDTHQVISNDKFMEDIVTPIVLIHSNFSNAMSALLSDHFTTNKVGSDKWKELFSSAYELKIKYDNSYDSTIEAMGLLDLKAVSERDPASDNLLNIFMNFKGFKALQAHRIAHVLWNQNRKDAARLIQSRCSDVFAVDIHPAALIGYGLMIDHATGIVIGETAVVGINCSFLHGVTLGSTGKDKGDRHPKIGNDVLIGCNSTILGNISIGSCSKIGSGSIVLKSIPSESTAVGNPARIVGKSLCKSASQSMDTGLKYVVDSKGTSFYDSYELYA